MVLKLFKAVWFLSLMGFMLIFMYIYASLPVNVVIQEGLEPLVTTKDVIFYVSLVAVSMVNALVFVISKLFKNKNDQFNTWFFGQIILVNFFFSTILGLINVLNSGEKFAFENLGVVIYGSVILIVLWAIAWPTFVISQKYFGKQAV